MRKFPPTIFQYVDLVLFARFVLYSKEEISFNYLAVYLLFLFLRSQLFSWSPFRICRCFLIVLGMQVCYILL